MARPPKSARKQALATAQAARARLDAIADERERRQHPHLKYSRAVIATIRALAAAGKSAAMIARALQTEHNVTVSKESVSTHASKFGIMLRRPLVTAVQREASARHLARARGMRIAKAKRSKLFELWAPTDDPAAPLHQLNGKWRHFRKVADRLPFDQLEDLLRDKARVAALRSRRLPADLAIVFEAPAAPRSMVLEPQLLAVLPDAPMLEARWS